MLTYLEVAGLTPSRVVDQYRLDRYGAPSDLPSFAALFVRAGQSLAGVLRGVVAWQERRRLVNRLSSLNDRLLADIGITREDIPAVLQGTHVRQPESAPIEHPSVRTVRVTDATAGTVANDNEAQIAA